MDSFIKAYEATLKLYERRKVVADMRQFAADESKDLKAKDYIGKNLKVKISEVEIVHYNATEEQAASDKARLRFEGKEKGLVLNKTNTRALIEAYGSDSDDWVGHDIGLSVKDYTDKNYGYGWLITPLDVKAPDFEDEIPF